MISLRDRIRTFPRRPGAYLFKDRHGRVLYVGKAHSLKARVAQYFNPTRAEPLKRDLPTHAADVDVIVTKNEAEALALEATLIQRHQPPYNVRLMDDSSYLYVKISKETYPKVQLVRRVEPDGAWYRGPFPVASAIRTTLREARKLFPWCTAKNPGDPETKPCFGYYLGLCPGICARTISLEEYQQSIEGLKRFLDGDIRETLKTLRARMGEASGHQEYERAAKLRDAIRSIETATTPQHVATPRRDVLDALGIARLGTHAVVAVLAVRYGRVVGTNVFPLLSPHDEPQESILRSFLLSYYPKVADGPTDILLPRPVEDARLLERAVPRPIRISAPTRGWKRRLLELARTNADEALRRSTLELESPAALERALRELQGALGVPHLPHRIEAYDISNIQGALPTGSLVVFLDGRPSRREYRRFRIGTVQQPNDVAMMREVLRRRFGKHGKEAPRGSSEWPIPDLIILDGGKPQLNAGQSVLRDLSLNIPIAALAKREEHLFVPSPKTAVVLSRSSPALFLLQRIRDEAHRFTLGYHQLLRKKRMTHSVLEEIPGVGAVTRKKLLRAFGSLREIRAASPEELSKFVGPKLAETIRTALR
ncbi:MAG: excinuclease ABC subunit C [Parcubacteria group bacterium Gr01-1014_38]|nr:MAG: excinuclease ABC subunit C [Parcubacteria group bacterium Gr01-1014_38]